MSTNVVLKFQVSTNDMFCNVIQMYCFGEFNCLQTEKLTTNFSTNSLNTQKISRLRRAISLIFSNLLYPLSQNFLACGGLFPFYFLIYCAHYPQNFLACGGLTSSFSLLRVIILYPDVGVVKNTRLETGPIHSYRTIM